MGNLIIVEIKAVGNHYEVDPEVIIVDAGDTVRVSNTTSEFVYVQIAWVGMTITIEPKAIFTFTVPDIPRGMYPYAVFCSGGSAYCWKSSMPIIIVPKL